MFDQINASLVNIRYIAGSVYFMQTLYYFSILLILKINRQSLKTNETLKTLQSSKRETSETVIDIGWTDIKISVINYIFIY